MRQVTQGIVEGPLYRCQQVVRFAICVYLHYHIPDFLGRDLVVAKGKAGCGQWDVALPIGDQLLTVDCVADLVSGRHQAVFLGISKDEIEIGTKCELVHPCFTRESRRVPAEAMAEKIAATDFYDHVLPAILKFQYLILPSLCRFLQGHRDVVSVRLRTFFPLTRLEKFQAAILTVLDGTKPQVGI